MLDIVSSTLGFQQAASSHSWLDVALLFSSRFIRLFAFGAIAPLLVLHLQRLGTSDSLIGLFVSLALFGDVLMSLGITWSADSFGRRVSLAFSSILMACTGLAFALSENIIVLLGSAMIGIMSPSGSEVGPFGALEVGMLSQLVQPAARTQVLMLYQILGFLGTALGCFVSGAIVSHLEQAGYPSFDAYRAVFYVYTVTALFTAGLALCMTECTEADYRNVLGLASSGLLEKRETYSDEEKTPLLENVVAVTYGDSDDERVDDATSALSGLRIATLCLLFSLESFASSLTPTSFISYYLRTEFNAPIGIITRLFGLTAIVGGCSQLFAGSLVAEVGIVATMVGAHMPAQVLTMALALAPSLRSFVPIFLVRSAIATIDVSAKTDFQAAIVPSESRIRFLGVVNASQTLASVPGSAISGLLANNGGLYLAFVISGALKLVYDGGLILGFRNTELDH